jgi:hypothetical protein
MSKLSLISRLLHDLGARNANRHENVGHFLPRRAAIGMPIGELMQFATLSKIRSV